MFKKILKLLTVSFVFIFLLVACEDELIEVPIHESDSIWQMDEIYHWHGCVTENCSSVFDKAEHSWSGWTVSKEPTCKTLGEEYRTCSGCNYEQRRSVSKLDHKYETIYKYDENGHWYECSICNNVQPNSKKEHNYEEFITNNDAKCDANGTETGICKDCGYVHTREESNSKLAHNVNKDVYEHNDTYHWHPCSNCDEMVEPVEHTLIDLEVIQEPTFEEEGISQGTCNVCNEIGKVIIPNLISASEVIVLSDDINVDINDTYDLEVLVGPEDAKNYVIECESNNDIISIEKVNNNNFKIKGVKNGKSIITVKVLNIIDEQTYSIVEKQIVCMVNSSPVVKYTFDQNVENSGSNQSVNGRVTTMSGDKIVDIDSSANVEYVETENGTPNVAIKLSQKKEGGNHFTITGLNIGINDFTIKTKLYIDSVSPNKDGAAYILGIGSETDPLGKVKDVKAPYFNVTYKHAPEYFYGSNQFRIVADSKTTMTISDGQHGVIPHMEWVELTIVKEGNNVYFTLSKEKLRNCEVTYVVTLGDKSDINITENCNLGFTANSGCQNLSPNASVLIDNIEIYDYAINHSFSTFTHVDGTCTSNEYESSKCDYCDYVFVKEINGTKLQHEIIDDYECDDDYHWSKCKTCNGIINKKEHVLDNITIIKNPTFIDEGLQSGTCTICGHSVETEIPELILASELNFNEDTVNLNIGDSFDLKAIVGPNGAENYKVEWKVDNNEYLNLNTSGNDCTLTSNGKIGMETITVRVTNTLNNVDYVYAEKTVNVYVYKAPTPVVQYKFDNGQIINSGTNQTVNGKVTTLSGNSIVNSTSSIGYTQDYLGNDNGAIKLNHKKEGGNHFTISGLNLGTNDFTIKTRMYIDGVVSNSSSSTYLFGIGSETDPLGNVKDVKSPYFNISYKVDEDKNQVRFVANGNSAIMKNDEGKVYLPNNEWIEVLFMRSGNQLTLKISSIESGITSIINITLSHKDALNFTENCNLGFAGNSGCQNGAPNLYTYYDEISIYDYAMEHVFMYYTSNNDATCISNETETSKCVHCDVTYTREIPNTIADHKFENYVSDKNSTCTSNGTETSKCTICDETNTREEENSKLEHAYSVVKDNGDGTETLVCLHGGEEIIRQIEPKCNHDFNTEDYTYNSDYHWNSCKNCSEAVNQVEHTLSDWIVVIKPTFETEGKQVKTCACGYTEEDTIKELVKVTNISFNTNNLTIITGDITEYDLIATLLASENVIVPDSYRITWTTSAQGIITLTPNDTTCKLLFTGAVGETVINVTVENVLDEEIIDTVEKTFIVKVLDNPIVRYTFDNGEIVNTGTNQTINGRVTTLSGTSIVENTSPIEYTNDAFGNKDGALKLGHKNVGGNHFTISGLGIGTGDFTIKTRMYIDGVVSNSNSSTYLFGIGNETDSLGNIKDVKAPYFNISMKKNGENNQVRFVANSESAVMSNSNGGVYVPHGKWIEVIVTRSGNNLTLSIVELDNCTTNSITIALSSSEALNFTENCNLGFAGNSGSQNGAPNLYTYYDDIMIFDYAI